MGPAEFGRVLVQLLGSACNAENRFDLVPSRRELLKFGGLGILGATARRRLAFEATCQFDHEGEAAGKREERHLLRIVRALSHVDSFDFKENASTQSDFDVRKTNTGIYVPHALFPRMVKVMDHVAHVRSFVSHEEVHLRGQYYVQAGRQLNVAFAPEIPSVGSVVAAELESRRKPSDTFPTYVSFNLTTNQVGALATGFLPPRFSVFDLNPEEALKGMTLDQKATELLEERWRLLTGLRQIHKPSLSDAGSQGGRLRRFQHHGKAIIDGPAMASCLSDRRRRTRPLR